jgi:biopolymer transport protein ExbB/TolQ
VLIGLSVVVLGLGLGLYIWQLALLQIVELNAAKERYQTMERRLSRLEERLAAFEEHIYAPGVKLVPGP